MSSDVQELPPGFEGWDGVCHVSPQLLDRNPAPEEVAKILFQVNEDFDENNPADMACVVQVTAEASRFRGYLPVSRAAYEAAIKSGDLAKATQIVQSHNLRQRIALWPARQN